MDLTRFDGVPKVELYTNLARITPDGWALLGYQDVMIRGVNVVGSVPTVGALLAFAAVFFIVRASIMSATADVQVSKTKTNCSERGERG